MTPDPDPVGGAAQAHRRRSGGLLLLALGFAWGVFGLINALWDRLPIAAIMMGALAGVGVVGLVSTGRAREADIRAHGGALVSAAALFTIALVTGQSDSIAWWYLLVVPVFVGQTASLAATLGWGGAGFALVVLVFVSEQVAVLEPLTRFTDAERSAGGILLTLIALAYAITIRRLAEAQLASLEDREATIRAQAAELTRTRDELAAARDVAEAASASKTQLMARVSHELRTPLNGLLGLGEILAEAPLSPTQREIARTLHGSAVTLNRLVEDLLDVTMIEEDRISVHPEPTDVRELVGDVVDTFSAIAAGRGVTLVGLVEANVPTFMDVDGLRLRQVLSNLVSNALKFTSEGSVTVRVRGQVEAHRLVGEFSVTDTGSGIVRGREAELFQAFERLDEEGAARRQGAGLGLFIAQNLARSMGTQLEVESEEGVGSTFRFRLGVPGSRRRTLRRSGLLVSEQPLLAVEPHAGSREALLEAARYLQIPADVCGSLEEAMDALERHAPRVIVLDAATVDEHPEAVRALRELAPNAAFVQSTSPSTSSVAASPPAGFQGVTLKPYRTSRLRALLLDFALDPEPSRSSERPGAARGLRCLVVDDDSTNRMVAKLMLERAGHQAEARPDRQSALAAVEEGSPDVVFLDLHMPDTDGFSLAQEIRERLDPRGLLWIVALTASTTDESRRRAKEVGMDDFLEKPIRLGLLRAALERAERGRRRRARESSREIDAAQELDLPVVRDLLKNLGRETAIEVVAEFETSVEEHTSALRAALAASDRESAFRAVHTLKSSGALVGARALAEIARELEATLETSVDADPDAVAELEARARRAAEELTRMLSPA